MSVFTALGLPLNNEELLNIAKKHTAYESKVFPKHEPYTHTPSPRTRLRIAYVGNCFRNYPSAHLTQDLYGAHDRSRFEIYVYSYGENDGSLYRKKIEQSCDHFLDVRHEDSRAICERIYNDKIDILVDLNGYTLDARPEIAASRPAPITVRMLGSAGTHGASFYDYIIADRYIIPQGNETFYTEHLVFMPDTYMVSGRESELLKQKSRTEYGLPENGFVFCAFHNNYKIEPCIFQIWMNILKSVPQSVLWLMQSGTARENLLKEAEKQGIARTRLLFAEHLPKTEHLARSAQADLFLDTRLYNAHTTASDLLWANVPILTCPGTTFQSRVSGSLLHALGLEDLITPNLETYEAQAIALAHNPDRLEEIKTKLHKNRLTFPLFDTACFTKHLERSYLHMWENFCSGQKSHIFVERLS